MTPENIIIALLSIFPYMSGNNRQCIQRRQEAIAEALHETSGLGVPVEVMTAVGFRETHLGCDEGEGGNWGAPIDPQHRHTAGTHLHAAQALMTGFGVCGSWDGAIRRFRTGSCRPSATGDAYLLSVRYLIRRLESEVR